MLKVLIVDDEYLFRKALRVKLKWEELGLAICGEAKNGEEAIVLVKQVKPDIALVDINMPVMDGLGFIEEIRDTGIQMEIIVITGYSEFNYAKQAINLGVRNYLLKPVEVEELKSELLKIKRKLEMESKTSLEIDILKKQVKKTIPVLREKLLHDLLHGRCLMKSEEILKKFNYLRINLKGKLFQVVLIEVDYYNDMKWNEEEWGIWSFAIGNISEEIFSENFRVEVCHDDFNRICLVIAFDDNNKEEMDFVALNICERVREAIQNYLKFTVTIGLSSIYKGLEEISFSYREASFAIKSKIIEGNDRVISYSDIAEPDSFFGIFSTEQKNQLLMSMRIGSKKALKETLDSIFNSFKERNIRYELFLSNCMGILSTCLEFIIETRHDIGDVFTESSNLFEELQQKKTFEEMKFWTESIIQKAVDVASESRKTRTCEHIFRIKEYLYQNYSDTDFKVENLSKYLYMNYSYLSHMFKKETGKTVNEFLTEIRVTRAKQLIDNGEFFMYNVSEKCGYIDPNYFSRCFKKYFGVTPTQYIESINK